MQCLCQSSPGDCLGTHHFQSAKLASYCKTLCQKHSTSLVCLLWTGRLGSNAARTQVWWSRKSQGTFPEGPCEASDRHTPNWSCLAAHTATWRSGEQGSQLVPHKIPPKTEMNPGGISFALVSLGTTRWVNFVVTKHCSNFRAFPAIFCLTCLVIDWTKANLACWRTNKIVCIWDRRSWCVMSKVPHSATPAWLLNTSAMQQCSGTEESEPTREQRCADMRFSSFSIFLLTEEEEGEPESCSNPQSLLYNPSSSLWWL